MRWLGTDRIGHWEHVAVEWIKRAIPIQIPPWVKETGKGKSGEVEVEGRGIAEVTEAYAVVDPKGKEIGMPGLGYDHGVKEAEKRNKSANASESYYL